MVEGKRIPHGSQEETEEGARNKTYPLNILPNGLFTQVGYPPEVSIASQSCHQIINLVMNLCIDWSQPSQPTHLSKVLKLATV